MIGRLNIPNGSFDAYEVKVNNDISKYQEKVKLISQFQRYFEMFASIRNLNPMRRCMHGI